MKKKLPYILILASIVLIIVNVITSENFDKGFWMRTLSSALLIIAMVLTIRSKNKEEN